AVIAECPGSGTNLVRVPVPQPLDQVADRLFRAATFLTNQKSPEMEKGEEQSDRDYAPHDDLHDAVQPVISCWQIFENTLGGRFSNHGPPCRMCPDETRSVPCALSWMSVSPRLGRNPGAKSAKNVLTPGTALGS